MAQGGILDPSFGGDGKIITNIGTSSTAYAYAVAVQTDGRLVVAGSVGSYATAFVLMRYLSDGTLDSSFGDGGITTTGFGGDATARDVAIQEDGKIIAVGYVSYPSAFALARYLPDGNLDPSFGDDGLVTTDFADGDYAYAVAVQADGRIVVTGSAEADGEDGFALARYLADGSLDASFSDDGLVTTAIGEEVGGAYDVAVQADGGIVVVGSTEVDRDDDFVLARYLPDGTLDPSFGGDGLVTTDYDGNNDVASAVTIDTDGNIIVAGYTLDGFALARYLPSGSLDFSFDDDGWVITDNDGGISDLALRPDGAILAAGSIDGDVAFAQYLPNGVLDPSFDGDGMLVADFGSGIGVSAIALQSDGRIAVVGHQDIVEGESTTVIFVARFLANGALDASFGGDGAVTPRDLGSAPDRASAVAVQPDGKIIAAGYADYRGFSDFALASYLPDGHLDSSFGDGGRIRTTFGSARDEARAVALQPDGKIVVAGFMGEGAPYYRYNFAVIRLLPDGQFDPTFGEDGLVTTDFADSYDYAYAVAVQPDGKIVVAGYTGPAGDKDFGLARYLPDGELDPTFSVDGLVTISFGGDDQPRSIALQPDGKIVVAGYAVIDSATDFAVTRHLPDGSLDASFSDDGRLTTAFGNQDVLYDEAHSVALQADGKIVVAGYTEVVRYDDTDFALARYLPDGSLDPSFGDGGLVTTDYDGLHDHAYAVAVQPDGTIVAAGDAEDSTEDRDFALARYLPDGSLDTAFGTGGRVTTGFGSNSDVTYAMALQPDGRIVAAGTTYHGAYPGYDGDDFALARYFPGTPTATEPSPLDPTAVLSLAPNPARGSSTVHYALSVGGRIRLAVYDVLGREVAVLVDGTQVPGTHEAGLDAAVLPTGVYFVRLQAGEATLARPLTVVR